MLRVSLTKSFIHSNKFHVILLMRWRSLLPKIVQNSAYFIWTAARCLSFNKTRVYQMLHLDLKNLLKPVLVCILFSLSCKHTTHDKTKEGTKAPVFDCQFEKRFHPKCIGFFVVVVEIFRSHLCIFALFFFFFGCVRYMSKYISI